MSTLINPPILETVPLPVGPRPTIAHWLRSKASALTWFKAPWRTIKWVCAECYTRCNLMRAGSITRVQVGCGKDIRKGWWNLDYIHFPGVDEIRDATLPWRHRDLDYVFAEHFIEHLTLHQGIRFLSNAGSALRQGGVLRISTPNLSNVIQEGYQLHGSPLHQRLDQTVSMNCCFHGYGHQFLYSGEFLRHLLEQLGFENVREFAFGESDDPNLRGLERHGPYTVTDGIPSIITFEASRGAKPITPSPELRSWLDRRFDDEVYR